MVDKNPGWVFGGPTTPPKESHRWPTLEDSDTYLRGQCHGLYENRSEADDPSSWELRKLACSVSSFVVGISSYGLGFRPYHSSGIILEHNREKLVLTSCYILGDGSKTPSKVTVLLSNKQDVDADIMHINVDHNIVLLRAKQQQELDNETTTACFITDLRQSGTSVSAVGRHYHHRLMASSGTINVRGDHLECDDLMSSSCNISEWGIGGPLIDRSGNVLGMNFFSKKGYTPFMPSSIIMKCVKHLIETGSVSRPWLGLRTRGLEETDINDFEAIYLKFQSTTGLVVTEVAKDSPAEKAGIFVGDVLSSCNRTTLSSPAQFAGVLFRSVESNRGNLIPPEKREILKVQLFVRRVADRTQQSMVLHVERFTPPVTNSWPVLPPPRVDNVACI